MGENNGFMRVFIIIFAILFFMPIIMTFKTMLPDVTLSPIAIILIIIGFIIAWFFDPLVTWLQKKKIPRLIGCILVYLLNKVKILLLV